MRVEIDTGIQRNHAKELRGLEANIRTSVSAVETTIDPEAFGVVNAFLAAIAGLTISAFKDAVEGQAQDMGTTAEGVLAMAKTHDTKDDEAKAHIKKAAKG